MTGSPPDRCSSFSTTAASRAQVAQYRAQLANYESIYARSRQLAAGGGESEQQLDADRTNYLVAKANYDNYASQLGYYVITSPITGLVVGKPTPEGQTVAQGISTPQVIMTIADMSKMQIKVMVDETDIKQGAKRPTSKLHRRRVP